MSQALISDEDIFRMMLSHAELTKDQAKQINDAVFNKIMTGIQNADVDGEIASMITHELDQNLLDTHQIGDHLTKVVMSALNKT